MKSDVVVVGSGGAGVVAALSAAHRGARVTVLEKAPLFGGTTAISGGGAWLPLNSAGRALGFDDSAEEVRTYLDRVTFGRVARSVLESFITHAPKVHEFLRTNTSVVLDGTHVQDYLTGLPGAKTAGRQIATGLYDIARLGEWAPKVRRSPWPGGIEYITQHEKETVKDIKSLAEQRRSTTIVGRGTALVAGIMEAGLRCDVRFVSDARVTALVRTGDRVTGVVVTRDGQSETYEAAQGVVLASGGFEWNRKMWDDLIGVPFDGPMSPPYNEGDGLRAAAEMGARLGNIHQVWWMPALEIPGDTFEGRPRMRSAAFRGHPGSIVVNRRGKRFGNESMNYNDFGKLMVAFDPHTYDFVNYPAFQIFDRPFLERNPLDRLQDHPDVIAEAPTLRGLAEKLGIDLGGLEEQVKLFNGYAEKGSDPDFHRGEFQWERKVYDWERFKVDDPFGSHNPTLAPLAQPPFYGHRLAVSCFGTKGGTVINERAEVVGHDDRGIPGLYAAGNVTAGVFGPAYPGGGSTLGPAVTFGYVAGISATS